MQISALGIECLFAGNFASGEGSIGAIC